MKYQDPNDIDCYHLIHNLLCLLENMRFVTSIENYRIKYSDVKDAIRRINVKW